MFDTDGNEKVDKTEFLVVSLNNAVTMQFCISDQITKYVSSASDTNAHCTYDDEVPLVDIDILQ